MVFHNCTCVSEVLLPAANMSAVLGQCPRRADCNFMFKLYMAVSVLGAFVSACGGTPGYIVLLRSIQPDLKSLALGMQTLIVRTLALIDRTCLKWGTKRCGGRGACRLYESNAFRMTFLGLIYTLYMLANLLWMALYYRIVQRARKSSRRQREREDGAERETNGLDADDRRVSVLALEGKVDGDRESTI
ncbi:hypothetical protein CRUP_009809 [Coryphaenoides rupestris]|nr:hypothetical protein CRUP_009809 [Coryphaenoides rupestris]